MKTIFLVTTTFLPTNAGTELEIFNLANGLASKYRVFVIAPSWYVKQSKDNTFNFKLLSYPSIILSVWSRLFSIVNLSWVGNLMMRRYIKKYQPSVLFFYFSFPTGTFFESHKFKGDVPVIVVPQGADVQREASSQYGLSADDGVSRSVATALEGADIVLEMSQSMRDSITTISKLEDGILKRVPTGTSVQKIAQQKVVAREIRRRHGIDDDDIFLLSVGRNHPKKGFDLIPNIIKVLETLTERRICWVVIGDGADRIEKESNVKFERSKIIAVSPIGLEAGELQSPPLGLISYYKSADVFCFPTRVEGFSLTFLDVLASCTPIVSTIAPGVVDIIKHNRNGLLSTVNEPVGIAKNIVKVAEDKSLAHELTREGLKMVQIYDWDCIVSSYSSIIEDVAP